MTTKTVWQTNEAGYLMGATVADACPMEAGVWLIPAGCVEDEPPIAPPSMTCRWVDGAWAVVERPPPERTPAEKLADFLAMNPDVKAMIDG